MDRGGIVQQAMQQDLLSLYHDFVEDLQHQQQQQQVAEFALTTSGCGCPGRAFGCFRKVFGQHKMALVHTRTVPPRTNLNAYTQLLYATCLELIPNFPYHHHHHQSATTTATTDMSMDNEDDLLLLLLRRAAHGLFALYTLYQTNPHRRQTNGTTLPLLRLLPMSLQGDNPKGLYRRSFAQKIRIDRERYLLLLQWNELALAQQAQCRQQQLHQQHHHPLCNKKDRGSNRDQSSLSSSSSSSCRCGGVAVDYCRVWERLKDCWDYSEYTGPRGVEGLAGHATYGLAQPQEQQDDDNDDDDDDDDGNGFSRMMESWATQPVVHNNNNNNNNNNNTHHYDDIVTMIQTYRTKIKAIQLPPENHNTKRRRRHHHHYQTQRIKKCLEPLYQQPQQRNYWDALLSKRLKGNNDAKEKAPPPPTVLCLGQANQTPPTAATMINNNNDNDNIGGASATAETTTKPSYRLVLSPLIPKGVQQGIQRALDGLLLREQDLVERRTRKPPLPPQLVHAHKEVHKGDDDDDVSSMGHLGGVSVLMTTTDAQKNDDDCNKNHVVATTTTPMVPRLVRNNNNNNNNNTVPVAPPSKRQGFLTMDLPNERTSARHDDDDDNDEFDSDLSSVSDGDDDDDDDYVSAATTAVGKQALDQLLASALDDGKPSMAAANQKTIKSIRTTAATVANDSLRAFTGSAEQLELLSTMSSTTAVSVAAGTQALRTLLSKAKDDYSPSPTETMTTTNTKRRKGQQQQQRRRPKSGRVDEDDDYEEHDTETESQATLFAAGQHALQELLSTAQTKTKPVKKQRIKDDEDDEVVPPTKHETALARKRRAPAKDGTTARKRRAPAKDIVSEEEDTIANDVVSTATGSSVGRGALQSLLSKATTRRGKRQQDRAPNATTNKDDDNAPTTRALSCEDSVVSEAVGKKALAQLLAASHK